MTAIFQITVKKPAIKTSYLTGRQYRKVTTDVAQLMKVD